LPTKKQGKTKSSGIISHIQRISTLMLEKKALNIKIIDVRNITTLTDFFVICTSESKPQTRAITDHIHDQMKANGMKAWHIEGYENLDWVLLDYINIVVHVFSRDSRDYYDLDRLWADGKITQVHDKK
jgi:ribosome-associated protein